MEWTCDHCREVQTTTGTMFEEKKVCISCYHILKGTTHPYAKATEVGDWVRSKTRNWHDLPIGQRIAGKVLYRHPDGSVQVSEYLLAPNDWERIDPPAEVEIPQHRSNIVNVAHYSGWAVDEFIEAQGLGFRLGNVVKYVARAGKKDQTKEIEDLEKARAYLSREILRRRLKAGLPEEQEKK